MGGRARRPGSRALRDCHQVHSLHAAERPQFLRSSSEEYGAVSRDVFTAMVVDHFFDKHFAMKECALFGVASTPIDRYSPGCGSRTPSLEHSESRPGETGECPVG